METYIDGSEVAVCLTSADTFWTAFYFIGCISLFFLLPFVILLVLYTIIAWNLMGNPGMISHHQRHQPPQEQSFPAGYPATPSQNPHPHRSNVLKYRKQVIFMLVAVVLSFFLCLLPFRAFTLWIILMPPESIIALGIEGYYNVLYFCRIMLYLNSALNPILYNVMSSKFRDGFLRLMGCDKARRVTLQSMDGMRKSTFHTNSTNFSSSSSSMRRDAMKGSSIRSRADSMTGSLGGVIVVGDVEIKRDSFSTNSQMNFTEKGVSAARKKSSCRQKSFDDIEELEEIEEPNTSVQSAYEVSYRVRSACVTPFLLQKAITDHCCRKGHHQL